MIYSFAIPNKAKPGTLNPEPGTPILPFALAFCMLFCAPLLRAEEAKLAWSFAQSGAAMAAQGKTAQAKDLFYKSLAADAQCPDALYELARIFEKENQLVTAGEFYLRASYALAQEEKSNPAYGVKRTEAERKIRILNPFQARFASLMEDYAKELEGITKKIPDSLTIEEALNRVDTLKLNSILAPDKRPKIDRPAVAHSGKKNGGGSDSATSGQSAPKSSAGVSPEIERALKGAGFTSITGSWTKKGDNVYEVTDGKLEAAKTDGLLQVTLQKSQATVRVMVRNHFGERSSRGSSYYSYTYGTGFGFEIKGTNAKLFAPIESSYYGYRPYMESEVTLPDGYPKNRILMSIQDGKMEYYINDGKKKTANYKIAKEGPFMIEINGTATIEDPRAAGQ